HSQNPPEKVVLDQITSIRDGDHLKSYHGLMSANYQKEHSLKDYRAHFQKNSIASEHQTAQHYFTHISGDEAKVAFDLIDDDGLKMPVLFTLSQEGRDWKINSIQFLGYGDDSFIPSLPASEEESSPQEKE